MRRLRPRDRRATVIALRYHNVYGPRMPRDTPYAGVASIFPSSLAAGQAPRVFEDGGQLRDFIHVRDIARANVSRSRRRDAAPGAFNVASGHATLDPGHGPALARRPGDGAAAGGDRRVPTRRRPPRLRLRRPAREGLGFEAEVDFAAGMAEFARCSAAAAA